MVRFTWTRVHQLVARCAATIFWLAAAAVLAAQPTFAQTQNLNLVWNPSLEPDISHYEVYSWTLSGPLDIQIQQVPASATTYSFPATPGVPYYFAVKAVNTSDRSSWFSGEVTGGVPTFAQPADQVGVVDMAITPLNMDVADPDKGDLWFSASDLPPGLSIDPFTGTIMGVPAPAAVGVRNVTVSAFDGTVTVQRSFTWTINAVQSCTYSLTSMSATVGPAGNFFNVGVIAPSGCAWTAASNHPSLLTVTAGSSGTGNGTVSFFVPINLGAGRAGTMTIAGMIYTVQQVAGSAPSVGDSGDFDGDGLPDITVYRPSEGTWYILRSDTGFTTFSSYQWGSSTDVPVAGDYDGDGKADLAVYRPSDGLWFIRWSGTGFTTSSSYQWGSSTDVPVAGDYDGDGKADLAVYRPSDPSSDGLWFIRSGTGFTTFSSYQWGSRTDVPVAGDYDGDGKADLAVYRPSDGLWFIRSGTGFTTFSSYQWGSSTDVPVAGDYDGDGKADLAVYRPSDPSSDGLWFIRSGTGFTTFSSYQWGISTDVPVAGDYDGDGNADLAVYRPSDGLWFIRSGTGFTTFSSYQWGISTDVPLH